MCYGKPLGARLKNIMCIVRYKTFQRWLRQKNGDWYGGFFAVPVPAFRIGRPPVLNETRALIIRMAVDNPQWGLKRIFGELKKLGIRVSRSSIQNILRQADIPPVLFRPQFAWRKFVRTHTHTLAACDFFTKDVWTFRGKVTLYVFFFIELKTRRLHIAGVTRYPKQEWVERRAVKMFDAMKADGFEPAYLIRDRDGKFSGAFDGILKDRGVKVIKTPARSPICNCYAERVVLSIKRECLNHFVVLGKKHLEYLLSNYETYYNELRPHQGIGNVPINGPPESNGDGEIEKVPILGGLFHHYYRKAA